VEVFQDISALKELERQREAFLATVSHDLKNPLTSILAMSQLLRLRAQRLSEPDQAHLGEGLSAIGETARRMATQIDELLDVTRAQMGRPLHLELAPTDVAALVARLVDEYQRTTARHTLRMQSAAATLVGMVDGARLQRALANLLVNAIKYSPQGGTILTTLICAEDQEQLWLTISVADEGVGIPGAEIDHVFDGFYRASNVTGQFKGTGLGLTSVRQIIEQHGGTVALESTEGAGTTVTLRLPLLTPPVEAST
jgi:signal transduction histidine kinase